MIQYSSMNEMWQQLIAKLARDGVKSASRNGKMRELFGWSGQLNALGVGRSILTSKCRKLDPCFAGAELIWYLSGRDDAAFMCDYAPKYASFANPPTRDGVVYGAYGARFYTNPGWQERVFSDDTLIGVSSQLEGVVHLLKKDPDSRQAVVALWDSADLAGAIKGGTNDLPCTVCLQFRLRDNFLHASTYMRSNDAWLGTPYDVLNFTNIQKVLAGRLECYVGTYSHSVGSMHIYESDLAKVQGGMVSIEDCRGHYNSYDTEVAGNRIKLDQARWIIDMAKTGHPQKALQLIEEVGSSAMACPVLESVAACVGKWTKDPKSRMLTAGWQAAWDIKYGGES